MPVFFIAPFGIRRAIRDRSETNAGWSGCRTAPAAITPGRSPNIARFRSIALLVRITYTGRQASVRVGANFDIVMYAPALMCAGVSIQLETGGVHRFPEMSHGCRTGILYRQRDGLCLNLHLRTRRKFLATAKRRVPLASNPCPCAAPAKNYCYKYQGKIRTTTPTCAKVGVYRIGLWENRGKIKVEQ